MTKKSLIFADDDKKNRFFAELLLKDRPYELRLAENGQVALDLFNEKRPDLVITDLYMPELNGIQLFTKIRMIDRKVPVVAYTGADFEDDDPEVKEIGFTEFLHKPVSNEEFLALVDKYLG